MNGLGQTLQEGFKESNTMDIQREEKKEERGKKKRKRLSLCWAVALVQTQKKIHFGCLAKKIRSQKTQNLKELSSELDTSNW